MTNEAKGAALVGALSLGLLWWMNRRAPVATVTTSEGFDLSAYGGPTSYPEPIQRFGRAIARQEGFYITGSISQRANNPGDLKIPNMPTLPGTSITLFPSADAGWSALYRQLMLILSGQSSHYYPDMTIAQMGRIWTTTEQEPWSTNVATFLGVPTSTPLWQVLA
jgi:hypothetical protein